MPIEAKFFGLAAEFDSPQALLLAARRVHAEGYRHMDAYTPFPVEGLSEAMELGRTAIPGMVLAGGISGGILGYLMMWYANVISYPWNIGGRPTNSWPAFIPITFELTILGAALAAFIGVLALNRLPQPYHPMFNLPSFHRATRDRFFICIESSDPHFDPSHTRMFLEELKPMSVMEVHG